MKIIKTASGKQTIKISKSEWLDIGKKAGWVKSAERSNWSQNYTDDDDDCDNEDRVYVDSKGDVIGRYKKEHCQKDKDIKTEKDKK